MSERNDQADALAFTLNDFIRKMDEHEAWTRSRKPFEPNRIRPAAAIGALEARKGPDGVWAVL